MASCCVFVAGVPQITSALCDDRELEKGSVFFNAFIKLRELTAKHASVFRLHITRNLLLSFGYDILGAGV